MPPNEPAELLTITFYGLAGPDPTGDRALLASVTVHGYLPDVSADDVRVGLLAMADSLPPKLAEQWARDRANTN